MHSSNLRIPHFLGLFLAPFCMLALQAEAPLSCVPGSTESKTVSASRSKIGWAEAVDSTPPIKRYLTYTLSESYQTTQSNVGGYEQSVFNLTTVATLDRSQAHEASGYLYGCQRWDAPESAQSPSYTGLASVNNTWTAYSCSATRSGTGAWSDTPCATEALQNQASVTLDWTQVSPTFTRRSCTTNYNAGGYSWAVTKVIDDVLSNEYDNEALRQDLMGMMGNYPSEWSAGASSATYGLSGYQNCGSASKMQYRFKFKGERDVPYLVQWDEITEQADGKITIVRMEDHAKGTGDVTYTGVHECLPPEWMGGEEDGTATRWIANLTITVDDSDGDNGAPGSGGPVWGSGGCSGCRGPQHGTRHTGGLDVGFSMGRAVFGGRAGSLRLTAAKPWPDLGSSKRLWFNGSETDSELVYLNGGIRQVKSPQAIAHIEDLPNGGYEVQYYLLSAITGSKVDGLYPLAGDPFVTWTVGYAMETIQQGGSSYDVTAVQLSEDRQGVIREWVYTYSTQTGVWSVDYPGNLRYDEGTTPGVGGEYADRLTVKSSSAGAVVFEAEVKYGIAPLNLGSFPFLLESSVGAGSEKETTRYRYDSSGVLNGTAIPLAYVLHADGNWEHFTYNDGKVSQKRMPVGNASTNAADSQLRIISYAYGSGPVSGSGDDGSIEPETARRIDETVLDTLISTRYVVLLAGERRDITCQVPDDAWNDPDNLVSVTKYFTSGANTNRVKSVLRPDGTMSLFDYALNATGTQQTNTVKIGQPNGGATDIVDGTVTVTVINKVGYPLSRTVKDIASGITLASDTYGNLDEFDRPRLVTHLDGSQEQTYYTCCGVDHTVDRDGVTTTFHYDDLRRLTANTRLSITTTNLLDALGNVRATMRLAAGVPAVTNRMAAYDTTGRLNAETNALGGVTTIAETYDQNGQLVRTTTYPVQGTRIETYYLDGQLKSVTGTAVFPVRYEYGVETDTTSPGIGLAFTKEFKLDGNYADTLEWTKTYTDAVGRTQYTLYADASGTLADNPKSQLFYNTAGQLYRQIDPDLVSTVYGYNPKGELAYTVVDMDRDGVIDFNGTDRITGTFSDVATVASINVRRNRTHIWDVNNSTNATLVSTVETSVDGLMSWRKVHDGALTLTSTSVRTLATNAIYYRTVTNQDNSTVVSQYQNGRPTTVTQKNSAGSPISQTTYQYDPHGRVWKVTDVRNGTTTYGYNDADQVTSVSTPDPGSGVGPQVTTTHYDPRGLADLITQPDGTVVSNLFFATQLPMKTFGSRTYPVQYLYDAQGRMTNLVTWTNAPAGSGAATTTWYYDSRRGWLTKKKYQGETDNGDDYDYTAAGRLYHRNWERGTNTTYGYDNAGDLNSINYSDSTPDVSFTCDRRGRRLTATQSGGNTATFAYNSQNQPTSESWTVGSLNGLALSVSYDQYQRRTNLSVNTATAIQNAFAYDTASRLQKAWQGTFSADYAYTANSPLVSTITFKNNGSTRLTTTKQYDFLNRLKSISSVPASAGQIPVAFAYDYDQANQRKRATLGDGSSWNYDYDDLGQVTKGRRQWNDGGLVPGQQFHYEFDDIGNRVQTKAGGDQNGSNLRVTSYTNNVVNQITGRGVRDGFDVMGIANPNSTVTVNGSDADYRKGEYFREEVTVSNSANPVWQEVNVTATNGGSSSNWPSGSVFVAKTGEAQGYDADGNQTSDGRWTYTWDAENRLIRLVANTAVGPQQRIDFAYDWMSRRIGKKVWNNTAGSGTPVVDELFIYDGWNLVGQLNATNKAVIRSFVWGLDLSGSEHGAGGVGGLLYVVPAGMNGLATAYDGNGNVEALLDSGTTNIVANYEYGPFGEPIRVSGSQAAQNPFRFSTKFTDEESGLVYYGYRYYNTSTGRWVSRDPIGEYGGMNLYGFIRNLVASHFDALGLTIPGMGPGAYPPSTRPPQPTPAYPPRTPFPQSIIKNYDSSCCDSRRIEMGRAALVFRFNKAKAQLDSRNLKPDADADEAGEASCDTSNGAVLTFINPTPPCWICFMDRRIGGGWDENFIHCYSKNDKGIKAELILDWFDSAYHNTDGVYHDPAEYYKRYPRAHPDQYGNTPVYSDCSRKSRTWRPDYAVFDFMFDPGFFDPPVNR